MSYLNETQSLSQLRHELVDKDILIQQLRAKIQEQEYEIEQLKIENTSEIMNRYIQRAHEYRDEADQLRLQIEQLKLQLEDQEKLKIKIYKLEHQNAVVNDELQRSKIETFNATRTRLNDDTEQINTALKLAAANNVLDQLHQSIDYHQEKLKQSRLEAEKLEKQLQRKQLELQSSQIENEQLRSHIELQNEEIDVLHRSQIATLTDYVPRTPDQQLLCDQTNLIVKLLDNVDMLNSKCQQKEQASRREIQDLQEQLRHQDDLIRSCVSGRQ